MDKHCKYAPDKLFNNPAHVGANLQSNRASYTATCMDTWCSVYCITCLEPEQKPTMYRSSEMACVFLYFGTIYLSNRNSFLSRKTHFSFWPNTMSMWIRNNVSEDNAASIFKIQCSTYRKPAPFWNVMWWVANWLLNDPWKWDSQAVPKRRWKPWISHLVHIY